MKVDLHILSLPMRHTFTIAHGSTDAVDTFIVELSDGEHSGYGESQAIDYYGVDGLSRQAAAAEPRGSVDRRQRHARRAFAHPQPRRQKIQDNSFSILKHIHTHR